MTLYYEKNILLCSAHDCETILSVGLWHKHSSHVVLLWSDWLVVLLNTHIMVNLC